jgi:hypothetical protein
LQTVTRRKHAGRLRRLQGLLQLFYKSCAPTKGGSFQTAAAIRSIATHTQGGPSSKYSHKPLFSTLGRFKPQSFTR